MMYGEKPPPLGLEYQTIYVAVVVKHNNYNPTSRIWICKWDANSKCF